MNILVGAGIGAVVVQAGFVVGIMIFRKKEKIPAMQRGIVTDAKDPEKVPGKPIQTMRTEAFNIIGEIKGMQHIDDAAAAITLIIEAGELHKFTMGMPVNIIGEQAIFETVDSDDSAPEHHTGHPMLNAYESLLKKIGGTVKSAGNKTKTVNVETKKGEGDGRTENIQAVESGSVPAAEAQDTGGKTEENNQPEAPREQKPEQKAPEKKEKPVKDRFEAMLEAKKAAREIRKRCSNCKKRKWGKKPDKPEDPFLCNECGKKAPKPVAPAATEEVPDPDAAAKDPDKQEPTEDNFEVPVEVEGDGSNV